MNKHICQPNQRHRGSRFSRKYSFKLSKHLLPNSWGKSGAYNFACAQRRLENRIVSFLQGNYPSDDESYIKRMHARTRPYVIIEGELFKQGVCSPLLKCLSRAEGQELMKEIRSGICGAHIGSRPLLSKVFKQGFYWPKAASDVAYLVQKM